MLCFPRFFAMSDWLSTVSALHVTQGLIARPFPWSWMCYSHRKGECKEPRLTPCTAIKTRTRSGYTMIVVIPLILFWNEAEDFWGVCCACLFPEPACSCGMPGYVWYAEHQLHGSQLLCLSLDHSLNVFNKVIVSLLLSYHPRTSLFQPVISYLCMQLSSNNFTLPLCSTWYFIYKVPAQLLSLQAV